MCEKKKLYKRFTTRGMGAMRKKEKKYIITVSVLDVSASPPNDASRFNSGILASIGAPGKAATPWKIAT